MRVSRWIPVIAATVGVTLLTRPAFGQDSPLVVELRGGVTVPVASFRQGPDRGGEIGRAPVFGTRFVYRGLGGWGALVGFSQHRFDCRLDGCPLDEYVLTTWDLGVHRRVAGLGWARVVMLVGRLERHLPGAATPDVPVHAVSSLSLGAEGGLGLNIPIGGRWGVGPAVRYAWFETSFHERGEARMRWLAVDLGVVLRF